MHARPIAHSATFQGNVDWADALAVCRAAARRHTRDPWDADDAAQEAVLRAFRHRAGRRDPAAHRAWLRTIARNEALRLAERAGRRAEVLTAAVDAETEPDHADAAGLFDERLRAVLKGLPARDRALLLLRYVADLPHAAIAAELGLPEATVRVRIHRVRIHVRTHLALEPAR